MTWGKFFDGFERISWYSMGPTEYHDILSKPSKNLAHVMFHPDCKSAFLGVLQIYTVLDVGNKNEG
jgi:hypothetical protein